MGRTLKQLRAQHQFPQQLIKHSWIYKTPRILCLLLIKGCLKVYWKQQLVIFVSDEEEQRLAEVQQLSADRHHTTDRSVYAPPRQGGTGTYSGVNTQVFSLQIPTGLPVNEHEICVIWITFSHRERVTWWSILSTVTYLFWFICQIELLNNLGHLLLLGPSTIFNKTLKAF